MLSDIVALPIPWGFQATKKPAHEPVPKSDVATSLGQRCLPHEVACRVKASDGTATSGRPLFSRRPKKRTEALGRQVNRRRRRGATPARGCAG